MITRLNYNYLYNGPVVTISCVVFNQHKGNIATGKFLQADLCFHKLQAHVKQTDRQNVQCVTVRRVVSLLD